MRKGLKRVGICAVLAAAVWLGAVAADREALSRELIRLHVVAASDSREDQAVKLSVRDAVLSAIREDLEGVADVEAAQAYLQENLPKIQKIANETLEQAGVAPSAVVSLCREAFDTRDYDSFSLPAGVYQALRIVIGEGQGHNWWCVAFPSLCLSATGAEFEAKTAGAGFSDGLTQALEGEGYEVRFFLLDCLGRVQNWLLEQKEGCAR